MFKGYVKHVANIKGNALKFEKVEFLPQIDGVQKVEIEGPDGKEVRSTIYLSSVPSDDDGLSLAAQVNRAILDRIAFDLNAAIEEAKLVDHDFSPIDPQPGTLYARTGQFVCTGFPAFFLLTISADRLRAILGQSSPPGERYYGLLRSARQSASPVEEFMHLYNILLMLYNDKQPEVDSFIRQHEKTIAYDNTRPLLDRQRKPRLDNQGNPKYAKETVYTRLRNEFAHKRDNVDIKQTKAEMEIKLGGLRELAKRAIELNP